MIAIIATAIACFVVGGILSYVLFRYVLKSKYDSVLKDAETEAEVIKKNKLLEVKEKFLNKKADLEKEVALRNQKIQQAENKLKQREMVLSQRQPRKYAPCSSSASWNRTTVEPTEAASVSSD